MTDAASPSNPSTIVEISEEYPYPSDVIVSDFVTMKLGGKDTYNEWERQISSLLKRHQMFGFINGELPSPAGYGKGKDEDIDAWTRSDSLVKSWILDSVSDAATWKAVNHLIEKQKKIDFTAKDLWDELQRCYGPSASTWDPNIIVGVGKAYPYPSHVSASSSVTVKLSGKNKYDAWETQILCLLKSHQMYGFINGQFPRPTGNEEGNVGDMEAWVISDSLVKGWILGSLSEEAVNKVVNYLIHKEKNTDFTAEDLWDELQHSYGPPVREQAEIKFTTRQAESVIDVISEDATSEDEPTDQWAEEENQDLHLDGTWWRDSLYNNILKGNTKEVIDDLESSDYVTIKPWNKITNNGNTILHVAVGSSTKNHELLNKLLEMTPKKKLGMINSDGSTVLHVAAIGGNTEVVDILVQRNPKLLLAKDKEGHTPLALSISNMNTTTSKCLYEHMKGNVAHLTFFEGKSGKEIAVLAISCQDFSLAYMIIDESQSAILADSDSVLMSLAQNYPPELNFWERRGEFMDMVEDRIKPYEDTVKRFTEYFKRTFWSWLLTMLLENFIFGFYVVVTAFSLSLKAIVHPFIKDTSQVYKDAKRLLCIVCFKISYRYSSTYHEYYNNSIFEATRRNASTFIRDIMRWFPDAIWSTNEEGHNFIQYSVINRSEKIYNLLYEMSEHKNIYKTIKDSSGNNLLHLAARLAPTNKLNLVRGAALQIQRELQWFKEVDRFVCPLNRLQKNSDDETPQMVFTREHKDLVIEGESWIKKTAESYTITAALIITIVFAAAITVPGGNNQESGIPIFTNNIAFKVFAISDAISLFTAVTSLLMFLSILTARFAEEDFLYKLPTKLIIGLTMLFLSTTAMIIAFGATLFLVFGEANLLMLIPIGALTCLPIASFVTLQCPLIIELISATYGRGIFVREEYGYLFY